MHHLSHHLFLRALPLVLGAIAFEVGWYPLVRHRSYPWREVVASVGVYLLRLPERLLRPLLVLPLAFLAWSHRIMTIPLDTAWGWAALFFGVEIAYYWMHRCSHEVRWLWASHVVHHTPEQIHLASAFRLGATELLSGNWLFYFPLYVFGLNPVAVGAMLGVNLFYQFWLHTDVVGRLGPLEWIFNTPAHHCVHHASNGEYLDRNYGGILIIWDRLFGTFAEERPEAPIVYGLVHPLGSLNPITIAFHEWVRIARDFRRAPSWRDRLRQLFGRPGDEYIGPRGREIVVPAAGLSAMVAALAHARLPMDRVYDGVNLLPFLDGVRTAKPGYSTTVLMTVDRTLSTPAELTDVSAKYHVPEVRSLST